MDSPKAEATLKQAVQLAEISEDEKMLGTGLVALGIYLQHQGNLKLAQPTLERALTLLPPADVNYICGQSHLQAIITGQSCGCGDTSQAYAEAFRQHILKTVPAGLLSDVQVTLEDDGMQVHLEYDHDLNEQEMQQVQHALQLAQVEFQNRMKGNR